MRCDTNELCCNGPFSKCSSKICKNYFLTTLDESIDSKKCESRKVATFVLENRYLVNSKTCNQLGRSVVDAKKCATPGEIFNDHKDNCKHLIDHEIIINGTRDFYNLNLCRPIYLKKLEILNLNGEIQFNETFSYLKSIETCLIIRNSSAFKNLHMFKNLQSICKGCERNGSMYKVIIENNENLESLWNLSSKLNIAEGKTFIKANPKLMNEKDRNGIFKCNFNIIEIDIITKKNSALIMTDFDMMASLSYNLTCEDCNTSFVDIKVMDKNFEEIRGLKSWHQYTVNFIINGTQKTDFCSFKTLQSDKIIENININSNYTEIILNWRTTKYLEYFKLKGFSYYFTFRNISTGEKFYLL